MHKLAPVEDAKTLFHEAKDWSVWRWLIEKKHARSTADAAWEALEACEEKVRAGWNEEGRGGGGRARVRRRARPRPGRRGKPAKKRGELAGTRSGGRPTAIRNPAVLPLSTPK